MRLNGHHPSSGRISNERAIELGATEVNKPQELSDQAI
jgi:hypothetical protein